LCQTDPKNHLHDNSALTNWTEKW